MYINGLERDFLIRQEFRVCCIKIKKSEHPDRKTVQNLRYILTTKYYAVIKRCKINLQGVLTMYCYMRTQKGIEYPIFENL